MKNTSAARGRRRLNLEIDLDVSYTEIHKIIVMEDNSFVIVLGMNERDLHSATSTGERKGTFL